MRYPIREPSIPFIPILILVVGMLVMIIMTALIASYEPKENSNETSKNLLERSEKLF